MKPNRLLNRGIKVKVNHFTLMPVFRILSFDIALHYMSSCFEQKTGIQNTGTERSI